MRNDILILGLTVALTCSAQISPEPFKLTTTAELVLLEVSVKDETGDRISNLTKDNFKVYEDGKLQKLTQFGNDDAPVTVGLVIDTSGSMRRKYADVVTAALTFIGASNRQDEMFVVNFGDRVTSGLPGNIPFTSDIVRLRTALSWAVPAGRTALYDAIFYSLGHLEKGKCARKTLMLVSDGGDNSSTHRADETIQRVRESRATIYTIGIFEEGDPDRNPGMLRRLSQISGGEAFFPKQLTEISDICRQIAADIRTRYTIGYIPVRSGEQGAFRKLKVTAASPAGHKLIVHTRTGYVLPPNRPSSDQNRRPTRGRGL